MFSKLTHQMPISPNYLYYGDNLTIMKEYIPSNSVNLIYLDPPFNSQRNYNLIYKKLTGQPVPEQEEAFCDAWELDPEKIEMIKAMPSIYEKYDVDDELAKFWDAWIKALKNTQPRLLAYLLYMTVRLFEMRRILHPHGSIYLHCDPHASHYMKIIMDGIFRHENFRNEISWHRSNPKSHATLNFPNCRDVILRYTKSDHFTFNKVYTAHDPRYVATAYRYNDDKGRYRLLPLLNPNDNRPNLTYEFLGVKRVWRWSRQRMEKAYNDGLIVQLKPGAVPQYKKYLSDSKGKTVTDDWNDIGQASGKETLGYPTQKPIALLERIIQSSSNPGDIIFDPFCGCGTAVYAAHLLNRKWIGCDIAILAVHLVQDVLIKRYGLEEDKNYRVAGVPKSIEAARDLFSHDPRQFQHWAVELARGFASAKYSGDRGIDGRIHFETKEGLKNMVISVKGGGNPTPAWMRELNGVVQREEDAKMGGLICLETPTKGMREEETNGGIYSYQGQDYHRLQIRTIQDLLDGNWFDTPSMVRTLGKSSQTIMPV